MVSRVCLGEVGAIFGLEISRLARSNAETERRLEFCALTDTLVIDTDGIYDLKDFSDRRAVRGFPTDRLGVRCGSPISDPAEMQAPAFGRTLPLGMEAGVDRRTALTR